MKFRWVKRLLIALVTVLVGVSIPVVLELHARSQARADLEKIIAELDRTDPRWRLEDIEADRQPVPPEKNSADTVIRAKRLLPKNWGQSIDDLATVPPPISLRLDQLEKLEAELKPSAAALEVALKLKDQPAGRYKIDYAPDFLSTLVRDQQDARSICWLLDLHSFQLHHRKDMHNAWIANRALLNAGRSLGDEPLLLSMLVRMSLEEMAVRSLERALAQGAFRLPQLEERQKEFEKEMTVPFFLIGIRGERGGADYLLTNIEDGKINLMPWLDNVFATTRQKREENLWDPIQNFFSLSMVVRSHATLLHFETKLVEAAKLLPSQRAKELKEAESSYSGTVSQNRKSKYLVIMLYPAVQKVSQAEQRLHTKLSCAIAALGAERFRLQKNRWPVSLEAIVKSGCMKKIPVDLFDGNPLRFRRTKDGLVIYSIGPEGNYDGKALDDLRNINEAVVRVEFRLWDPAQRRQPPLPAKPKE
jgi:hypothetical protein